MSKQGANYKKSVDETVKELLQCRNVDGWDVTRTLNESFNRLDRTSNAERDAMRDILGTNLLLSKAIGQLAVMVNNLAAELETVKAKIK